MNKNRKAVVIFTLVCSAIFIFTEYYFILRPIYSLIGANKGGTAGITNIEHRTKLLYTYGLPSMVIFYGGGLAYLLKRKKK